VTAAPHQQVAECKFLNNQLVEVVAFMENISLKDGTEKDLFFKRLPAMIPAIPEPVAIRKILPLLSNALEYGGAPATAVSSLLLIGR
jgi:SCY1-like protein 1